MSATVHENAIEILHSQEVGLALKRDVLHKVEWVGRVVVLLVTERDEQTVRDKLNVLAHKLSIHADKRARERVAEERLLNRDSLRDDRLDNVWVRAPLEVAEEQAGEIRVQALVTRDELVREGETGHETALLEPEDRRKRPREEDTLHGGESNEALGKAGALVADPAQRPVGLLLHDGDRLHRVKEELALCRVADVRVDEERVGFRVDVLPVKVKRVVSIEQKQRSDATRRDSHHDLETVEAPGLCSLNFATEALDEVLVDNAIRRGKEGEDMADEVALIVVELRVPVVHVLREVDLFGGPEGCFCLLVHLPDLDALKSRERARMQCVSDLLLVF